MVFGEVVDFEMVVSVVVEFEEGDMVCDLVFLVLEVFV